MQVWSLPGSAWPKACLLPATEAALSLPEAVHREASLAQKVICMRGWGRRGSGPWDIKTRESQGDHRGQGQSKVLTPLPVAKPQ